MNKIDELIAHNDEVHKEYEETRKRFKVMPRLIVNGNIVVEFRETGDLYISRSALTIKDVVLLHEFLTEWLRSV